MKFERKKFKTVIKDKDSNKSKIILNSFHDSIE